MFEVNNDDDEGDDLEENNFPGCNGNATAELLPRVAQSQPNRSSLLDPCTVLLIRPRMLKKVDRRL